MIAILSKKFNFFFLMLCLFLLSFTSNGQIVLNEVMAQPAGATTGVNSTQGLIGNGKEYIELYNKGCSPVNVAGYFIACRSDFASPTINGGTFRIPNIAAATIPAKGHLVLGNSVSSGNAASVDIVLSSYVSDYCIYSANFLLSNTDGWVGLFDAAGNPIDALYWSSASANISQGADFGGIPCVPTGSAVVLESAQQINASFAGVLSYVALNTSSGLTYSRIPDGGTWTKDIAASINDATLTPNNCNNQSCFTPTAAITGFSYTNPVCTNGTATPIPVANFVTGGTYSANSGSVSINSSTGVIDLSSSTPGSYTITYTLTASGCSAAGSGTTNIVISAATPPLYTKSSVNATTCSGSNGSITITPTSSGLTYNWVTGPLSSPIPAGNLPGGATDEHALINLGTGTYCVNITSPSAVGSTVTSTLFAEDFEAGITNWTIDNTTGPNLFVRNNAYTGGNCQTGLTNFIVAAVPNQPLGVTGNPQSYYLHIKATTTTGATCGAGSSTPFPPDNANFDGVVTDQKTTLNTVINTTGKTNVKFNFYWLAQGETSGTDDYGAIEYSINGGTTWIQSGAKLRNQPTWISGFRTETAWDNQPSLRFRIRWVNDASSSIDPPLAIDQILITADVVTPAQCGSIVQECFNITAPSAPLAPTATVTVQPSCVVATGTITVTVPANGSGVSYTVTGTNPVVSAQSNSTGVFTALAPGVYSVITTVGGCPSPAISLTVTASPSTPTAPTATVTAQPTCAVATGTITVTVPANGSGVSYTLTGTNPVVAAQSNSTGIFPSLASGVYSVTTTVSGCTSAGTPLTINAQPATPTAPTATVTAQPSCSVATGTITVTVPATGSGVSYTVTGTNPVTSAQNNSTGIFAGLAPGIYDVTTTVNGCTSLPSSLTVNAPSGAPLPPAATVTSQPSCAVATGTITVTTPVSGDSYTIIGPSPSTTAVTNLTGIFPTLASGVYSVTTTVSGCTSAGTPLTINAQPPTPAVPTVSIVQPTCVVAIGSITVTVPANGLGVSYTLTGTNPVVASQSNSTGIFPGLAPGIYDVTATLNTCTSSPRSITINTQPATPAAPTATVTAQPICSFPTGTITVTVPANGSGVSYTVTGTNPVTSAQNNSQGVFAGLAPGIYDVTTTVNGCTSLASSLTIIASNGLPPAAPGVVSPLIYCQNANVPALTATGSGLLWYPTVNGGTGSAIAPTPSTATIGSASYYVAQSIGGCEGPRSTINVVVVPNPIVNAGGPLLYMYEGQPLTLNGSVSASGISFIWLPISNSSTLHPVVNPNTDITYTLQALSAGGCPGSDTVRVVVLKTLYIPNVFSPNGDNINDTWVIPDIANYPGITVDIFNRYGQLLLRSTGYSTPWDGKYQGKDLPVGTYFYIINTGGKRNKILSGSISIIR